MQHMRSQRLGMIAGKVCCGLHRRCLGCRHTSANMLSRGQTWRTPPSPHTIEKTMIRHETPKLSYEFMLFLKQPSMFHINLYVLVALFFFKDLLPWKYFINKPGIRKKCVRPLSSSESVITSFSLLNLNLKKWRTLLGAALCSFEYSSSFGNRLNALYTEKTFSHLVSQLRRRKWAWSGWIK